MTQEFRQTYLMYAAITIAALAIASTFWLRPTLPVLADVSAEDTRALRDAAAADLRREGPVAALAKSSHETVAPSFYITSNLKDGAKLDVRVQGVSDTLVNRFEIVAQTSTELSEHIAHTRNFLRADGHPFNRGEYIVSVMHEGKLLAQRTYFVGGNKDQKYQDALRKYHEHLAKQARSELVELKQISKTLNRQVNALSATVQNTCLTRKQWEHFDRQWLPQQEPVANAWTKDTDEHFYFEIYEQLKAQLDQTNTIHKTFAANMMADSQLIATLSDTQASVQTAIKKIVTAEKLPLTANGMPPRP